MSVWNAIRSLRIPAVIIGLLAAAYLYPMVRYGFLIRQWEAEIKRQQDPAELQAWASHLRMLYGAPQTIQIVTNKPPPGIPRSRYGPTVALINGSWSGGGQDHVQLGWGGGFLHLWGIQIGDSNFVCDAQTMWKPGIYFFSSP
jgi:hypothetical protein